MCNVCVRFISRKGVCGFKTNWRTSNAGKVKGGTFTHIFLLCHFPKEVIVVDVG